MNNPVNLVSQKQKVRHQQGFASLLFVLLIGLSLVIIVLAVFLSLRGLQDSTITSHAQTQAEEKTTIGVKALSNFLSNKTDTQLSVISGGTVTDSTGASVATYTKSTSCPTSSTTGITQYCFDVTASSGGASATMRMVYQRASTVGSTTLTGSVFAGGLVVAKSDTLTGNGVSISVGAQVQNGTTVAAAGTVTDNSGKVVSLTGITVSAYTTSTFITADSLKDYSNYQFTSSSTGTLLCTKLNLYSSVPTIAAIATTTITKITPTNCVISTDKLSAITRNSDGTWTIDLTGGNTIPPGVFWFDKDVTINLDSGSRLINTIISKGSISATSPNSGTVNSYAPYYYNTLVSSPDQSKVCGNALDGTVPTQFCNLDSTQLSNGAKFDNSSAATFPGSISTILFLTNDALSLDAAQNATINYYGNLLASYGAGGTGSASGKFTGTGTINITGNLVVAGTTDTTTMTGNIKITLGDSTATSADVIPSYTYANSLRFIKYM